MDRSLVLELVRVTEAAAMAAARWMGRGEEKAADSAAVEAMRRSFDTIGFSGRVVIGEGERDEAPMLYIGEVVGGGGHLQVDIAVDPLEGTTICASGGPNSISVLAVAEKGNFLHAPDTYMQKIACGPGAKGAIDIEAPPADNVKRVAKALGKQIADVTVVILDRPRHQELIAEVRRTGARIRLIGDGDISAAIATCKEQTGVDLLLGIGGAPEGVIAAAAMRCIGGDMQGRLTPRNESEIERALTMGITDMNRIYSCEELAKGDVMFVATGVTTGDFLKGVRFSATGCHTTSVVMRSKTHTIRTVETDHYFQHKPAYSFN
ncbi:MAG: class II fructose-bisphosphatase [Candidatus Sericytochromatia bacterium]|nr:class II fructose-bisphosphatase [Candidatus Sericytochromatia bacterium]